MSWSTSKIGKDAQDAADQVGADMDAQAPYCGTTVANGVKAAVAGALSCFPAGTYGLLVESHGHTDGDGGSFHLAVRSVAPPATPPPAGNGGQPSTGQTGPTGGQSPPSP